MEEQLITFDTAKLAKKKGFDIPTLYGVYGQKMKLTYNEPYELVNWNARTKQQPKSKATSIPTQSLLQRWLREEHNMHILMNVGMNDGTKQTFYCNVFLFGKNKYIGKFRSKTSIYTYEEALEIGLYQALKLINH